MKNALGEVWRYRNSKHRGMTWAAEIRVGNALLCVYGQKNMKSSISIANKCAKRLGWKLVEPWKKIGKASKGVSNEQRDS